MRGGIFTNKIRQLFKKTLVLATVIIVPGLFAYLLGSFFQETKEQGTIPVAIVDLDRSEYSKLVVDRMKKQDRIEIIELTQGAARRLLERGEVDCVFIIKATFFKQLLTEKREETVELWTSPLTMAAAVVQEIMASEITRITSNIKAANRVTDYFTIKRNLTANQAKELWSSAYDYTDKQWIPEPLMTIDYKDLSLIMKNEAETTSKFNIYIGMWMAFTMLTTFVLTEPLLKERQSIFIRIKSTYHNLRAYLLQSGLAYFLLLFVQTMGSLFFLKSYFSMDLSKVYVDLLVFLFFCLSIGIGLALHVNSLGLYYSAGLFLTLVINIMGGSFFPLEGFPMLFTRIGEILPQYGLMHGISNSWYILLILFLSSIIWIISIWKLERFYD